MVRRIDKTLSTIAASSSLGFSWVMQKMKLYLHFKFNEIILTYTTMVLLNQCNCQGGWEKHTEQLLLMHTCTKTFHNDIQIRHMQLWFLEMFLPLWSHLAFEPAQPSQWTNGYPGQFYKCILRLYDVEKNHCDVCLTLCHNDFFLFCVIHCDMKEKKKTGIFMSLRDDCSIFKKIYHPRMFDEIILKGRHTCYTENYFKNEKWLLKPIKCVTILS